MITLYGANFCAPCGQVKKLLAKFGAEHEFIDIETLEKWPETIPLLVLEDGTRLEGAKPIAAWLTEKGVEYRRG